MYEDYTPERIQQQIRERAGTTVLTGEGSFFEMHTKPVAYVLNELYHTLDALIPIAFVDETSGLYIDKRAGEFGIARKPGQTATVALTLTGSEGCSVPTGTLFRTEDGLEFATIAPVTIDGTGTATVIAAASEIGVVYNIPAGTIVRPTQSVSKLDTVTNAEAAAGGMDEETDEALLERLYAYWREPATSGNRYHYEHWAMGVNGIGAARCIEVWNGPGTVKVFVADMNIQPVKDELLQAVTAEIEKERPVCADVTVESVTGVEISIAASITVTTSGTLESVKKEFVESLEDYIRYTVFDAPYLSYNQIAYLLMSADDIVDYDALTINGAKDNIALTLGQVPVLGTVEVTASA